MVTQDQTRDYVRRAYRALCTSADIARRQDGSYRIDLPPQGRVVVQHGRTYVFLGDAVFRVRTDGVLKRLRRYPKEL